MTTPTTPAADAVSLRDMIMNLRCDTDKHGYFGASAAACKLGHRDARHAAAELATARESALVAERDALRAVASDLLVALRDMDALACRDRPPGYPVPNVHKRAIESMRKAGAALAAPAVEGE